MHCPPLIFLCIKTIKLQQDLVIISIMDLSDPLSKGITDKPTSSIANLESTLDKNNIHQISIAQSFSNFTLAHDNDSTWTPKILMSFPCHYGTNAITLDNDKVKNLIDIVPYTVKPSMASRTINEKSLNYPKNCTFYFPGYDGVANADKLKKDIINAVSSNGTSLKVETIDHYTARGNK